MFSFVYLLKYVPFSCLGIRMYACLFEGYKEIMGIQATEKLCIYTNLTFNSSRDNRRITEKLFTQ